MRLITKASTSLLSFGIYFITCKAEFLVESPFGFAGIRAANAAWRGRFTGFHLDNRLEAAEAAAEYLPVPVDHFHNDSKYEPHVGGLFGLRYWINSTFFEPGGAVIIRQAGEYNAALDVDYCSSGVLPQVASTTHGMMVVLEHRYYGRSIPTSDLSTESLRFLTKEQAMADAAYFAQNVVFRGYEDRNLTASKVPYIAMGSSYAGGLAAFLRQAYPDVFYGAISLSGRTQAFANY